MIWWGSNGVLLDLDHLFDNRWLGFSLVFVAVTFTEAVVDALFDVNVSTVLRNHWLNGLD